MPQRTHKEWVDMYNSIFDEIYEEGPAGVPIAMFALKVRSELIGEVESWLDEMVRDLNTEQKDPCDAQNGYLHARMHFRQRFRP